MMHTDPSFRWLARRLLTVAEPLGEDEYSRFAVLPQQEDSIATASVTAQPARVIVGDEDRSLLSTVSQALRNAGYECESFTNGQAVLTALKQRGAEVVIVSMSLPGIGGFDLMAQVKTRWPDVAVVMVASEPSVDNAVAAMRQGAFDLLSKPIDESELCESVARAIEMGSLKRENRRLRQALDLASSAAGFIAESASSKSLVAIVRRVAPARSPTLLEGESGTGKELVSRMLHYWSKRADGPFIAVNCKAFADGVVESELFGHEKGSFTGAIAARAGVFERASGGTLFLDEIAEAGPDFQAKLLRVLEDGEVLRVGASKPRKVDVRILAATNRVLRKEVASGRFRADLFFRLNVIPIRILPLRERPDDILPLARHFLAFHSAELGRPLSLARDAERLLQEYSWPGNVRELENVVERAVVMSGAEVLGSEAFALDNLDIGEGSAEAGEQIAAGTLQECLDRAAAVRIRRALAVAGGNRVEAASALGVDRTTLYRLMRKLGLQEAAGAPHTESGEDVA